MLCNFTFQPSNTIKWNSLCFYCTYYSQGSLIDSLVNHGPLSKLGEVISWENLAVEVISVTYFKVSCAILIGELSREFSLEWYAKTSWTSLVMGRRYIRGNWDFSTYIFSFLNIPLASYEVTWQVRSRCHMDPQTSDMDSRIYQTGSCLASKPTYHQTEAHHGKAQEKKKKKKQLKGREV